MLTQAHNPEDHCLGGGFQWLWLALGIAHSALSPSCVNGPMKDEGGTMATHTERLSPRLKSVTVC